MRIEDAQREMRDVHLGGSVGGFVSGALWLGVMHAGELARRRAPSHSP